MIKDFTLVCIAVKDLEAAVKDYTEMFEMAVVERAENAELGYRTAQLSLGNTLLELMAPITGDEEWASFLETRGEGAYLIGLEVDDIDAAVRQVTQGGGRIIRQERAKDGVRMAFVHPQDAHGVMVELLQAGPGAPAAPAIPANSSGLVQQFKLHCLIVHDLDKVAGDWSRMFGTQVEAYHEGEELGNKNVMVPLGSRGAYLEIMTPRTGEEPWAKRLRDGGESTFLIGFDVEDMERVVEHIRAGGRRVVGEFTSQTGGKQAMVHPLDAHGVMIELMQPAPAAV